MVYCSVQSTYCEEYSTKAEVPPNTPLVHICMRREPTRAAILDLRGHVVPPANIDTSGMRLWSLLTGRLFSGRALIV